MANNNETIHYCNAVAFIFIFIDLMILFMSFCIWLESAADQKPLDIKEILPLVLVLCYFTYWLYRVWRDNCVSYNNEKIIISITDRKASGLFPRLASVGVGFSEMTELTLMHESDVFSPFLVIKTRQDEAIIIDTKPMTKKYFRKIVELCKAKGVKISSEAEAV